MADARQDDSEQIRTISSGQGAIVANRGNAASVADAARRSRRRRQQPIRGRRREPEFQMDRRLLIGIIVAVLAVVSIIGFIAFRAVRSILEADVGAAEGARIERTELDLADGDASVEYDGYLYSVQQTEGGNALVRTAAEGGEPLVLAELAGSPVALVLYDGSFIVGENVGSGWDVVVYTMGEGSMMSALVDADGNPVAGEGVLSGMSLEGDELALAFEEGQALRVPLR